MKQQKKKGKERKGKKINYVQIQTYGLRRFLSNSLYNGIRSIWIIQGVREWSPKNFRVSLSGKMWSKTFIPLLDKLNRFLKIKLFPVVLGLLKYCLYVSI
jgi:hypothetical protein